MAFTRICNVDISNPSMQQRRSLMVWICAALGVSFFLHSALSVKDSGSVGRIRKLLEDSESTWHKNWIEKGGGTLCFIILCFMFCGISIICDEFFVNCLETISEQLNLSADVAGATFMAAGSSAPELFTSLVALADSRISNEIEVGTIIGATAFNILVIVGVSALFSDRKLNLDYRPLLRDGLFYVMAMAGVMVVFYDGRIYWWEGLIFVSLYGVYILAMKFNTQIMNRLPSPLTKFPNFNANVVDLESLPHEQNDTYTSDEDERFCSRHNFQQCKLKTFYEREENDNAAPLVPLTNGRASAINATNHEQDNQIGTANTASHASDDQEVEDDRNPFSVVTSTLKPLVWLVSTIWRAFFYCTALNCSKPNSEKRYIWTFIISLLWIAAIAVSMVELANELDSMLGIPGDVMGQTLIAVGILLRSALRTFKAARAGNGDVDVANAIGSNVFDVWLGLGLPWFLVIPFIGEKSSLGCYIEVDNSEFLPAAAITFGVLFFYLASVIYTRWTLDKRHGALFIALYIAYLSYYIIVVWVFDVFH